MAKEYSRTQRIGPQLLRSLSELVRRELRDPRLALVTLTAVELGRDVGHARVFFSMLDDSDPDPVREALQRSAGFLRGHLGRTLKMRQVPELTFQFDDSMRRAAHVTSLIDAAVAGDETRHAGSDDRD